MVVYIGYLLIIHYHVPDKIEQTLAAARMLTPSGPVGQTHWSDSTANNAPPAAHSADAQLKVYLRLLWSSNFHFCLSPHAPLQFLILHLIFVYNSKNWQRYLRKLVTSKLAQLGCTNFIALHNYILRYIAWANDLIFTVLLFVIL